MVLTKGKGKPDNIHDTMRKYPRLTGHLICESLGYFTPEAAAHAILDYIQGEPCFCEWYCHMAQGYSKEKLLEIGRQTLHNAFIGRHFHSGYMAEYLQARALVNEVLSGGKGPLFASWF